MTNEELDQARAKEAWRLLEGGAYATNTVVLNAARLAREGWTPPVAVDPDIAEAETLWLDGLSARDLALAGIKRGRELAAAEAKPGMVWKEHDGSEACPVSGKVWVVAIYEDVEKPQFSTEPRNLSWYAVTDYAIITPPEDVA